MYPKTAAKETTSQPKAGADTPDAGDPKADFAAAVYSAFGELSGEISQRNANIQERDDYIFGDLLQNSLDIPIGHDNTPVNWLRRTVEIHKNMFMSRGFQVISTYDSKDISDFEEDKDREQAKVENKREKVFAEQRKNLIDAIIRDNGGEALWATLAENASAVGDSCLKAYYDTKANKYVLSQIESIENVYVLWNKDDFRQHDAIMYAYQVSKSAAIRDYGADQDVATSKVGEPLVMADSATSAATASTQPMVTIAEVTGKVPGWASEKGQLKKVPLGKETEINVKLIGNKVTAIEDDPKNIPKYYILPNKRQRRRPWGSSDVSDAAIYINLSYIETLSDWRTVASKVNFPKYKAFGFGPDATLPKSESRKIQAIPLAEGQDLAELVQGDSSAMDFKAQMDELKEQFVRETGISRVLFDDPSVTLNSNQALLTSMKPTSDIAEAKKQLWGPILIDIFMDALEVIGLHNKEIAQVADPHESWNLRVQWPSIMQKEDPVYQQMLLNRFNANTLSIQSFLEAQGESKEELDRIREELDDPVTAAILGKSLGLLAQNKIQPPSDKPQVKTNISLRGDLTPAQEANHAQTIGLGDGPFGNEAGPQGIGGLMAQESADNQDYLTPGGEGEQPQPIFRDEQGNEKVGPVDQRPQVATQANNQPGQGVMSQPGSGATPVSAEGAVNQQQQQAGA